MRIRTTCQHVVLSFSLLASWAALACRAEPKENGPAAAPPPAPVEVAELKTQELWVEHEYLGEVWAAAEASLTAAEPGRVRQVKVVEGDRVKKGQLLVELDDQLARAELGQALAQKRQIGVELEQAEREAKRFAELEKEAVTSALESEREQSEALALGARDVGIQATVQAQNERVQRHRVVAPFAGVVARRHVDLGDWLTPGQAAIDLVTDDRVEILVRVSVELLDRLAAVDTVRVGKGDHTIDAKLSGAVNALERSTRTALMRLDPQEVPPWLRPGTSVDVIFRLLEKGQLVVPRDALVQGVATVRVVRVKDGKADPVNVEVVVTSKDQALVKSDALALGDRVVIRGNERLRPGQPVAPAPVTSAPAPKAP